MEPKIVKKAKDWHPADIKAALEKAGWSLRKLSISKGYSPDTLKKAMRAPWPRAEKIIAATIGVPPWEIWPSRYHNGKPNRPKGAPKKKFTFRAIPKKRNNKSCFKHKKILSP